MKRPATMDNHLHHTKSLRSFASATPLTMTQVDGQLSALSHPSLNRYSPVATTKVVFQGHRQFCSLHHIVVSRLPTPAAAPNILI